MTNKISPEVQDQGMKVAKSIKKPGQTKEQTKLIAQGIEKGISEYKKQQSKKARSRDKDRKVQIKQKEKVQAVCDEATVQENGHDLVKLPWLLLVLSWLGFIFYLLFN
jgi:hypothetical protein